MNSIISKSIVIENKKKIKILEDVDSMQKYRLQLYFLHNLQKLVSNVGFVCNSIWKLFTYCWKF